jgi:hypothetical protein
MSTENRNKTIRPHPTPLTRFVEIRFDRVQILSDAPSGFKLPLVPGFLLKYDRIVPAQTIAPRYRRVRLYFNPDTLLKVFIHYDPSAPWLSPVKLTFCPNDFRGLRRRDMEAFLECFPKCRLLTAEVAFDFLPASGVDFDFVRAHAVFGKSRPNTRIHHADTLRFGTRNSAKLVRCYQKANLGAYRVEIQLNSCWMRKHDVRSFQDLRILSALLIPNHFRFVRLDRRAIENYLARTRFTRHPPDRAISEPRSIHAELKRLRNRLGVVNGHRFLRELPETRGIRRKFQSWCNRW